MVRQDRQCPTSQSTLNDRHTVTLETATRSTACVPQQLTPGLCMLAMGRRTRIAQVGLAQLQWSDAHTGPPPDNICAALTTWPSARKAVLGCVDCQQDAPCGRAFYKDITPMQPLGLLSVASFRCTVRCACARSKPVSLVLPSSQTLGISKGAPAAGTRSRQRRAHCWNDNKLNGCDSLS